jgi:hypothetical protein
MNATATQSLVCEYWEHGLKEMILKQEMLYQIHLSDVPSLHTYIFI